MAACVAGLMLGASSQAAPGAAEAGSKPKPKPDPVFAPVTEVKGLPRILLIGDSISMGYTLRVRELLAGKANVHRIPTNGGPTSRGLQSIDAWLGKGPWDVSVAQ